MKHSDISLTIIGIIIFLSSLFGCQTKNAKSPSLSVAEFEEYIADTTVVRLDVRTAEEYAEGHIANTVNIDILQPDFEAKAVALLPKAKTIAVYCGSGKRSKKAVDMLTKNHFTVIELNTGYNGWIEAGKKVTR